jgi:hypothetical protein
MTLQKIENVDKYFNYDDKNKRMTFTGKRLLVHIPKRYESRNLVEIGNTVKTLGILNLIIDDRYYAPICMLAKINIVPDNIQIVDKFGVDYYELELSNNGIFIDHTETIKDGSFIYDIFVEFITLGRLPYFFTYESSTNIFDKSKELTNTSLWVDHVIFEMISAHLHRDSEDVSVFYRHTDMKKEAQYIPLRSISLSTESTTSKLLGSYFDDGLTASLVTENTEHKDIENYLRS